MPIEELLGQVSEMEQYSNEMVDACASSEQTIGDEERELAELVRGNRMGEHAVEDVQQARLSLRDAIDSMRDLARCLHQYQDTIRG